MTFPLTYSKIWVRGRIIDMGKAARGEADIGFTRPVIFTPSPTPAVVLSEATKQIIATEPFSVTPDVTTGYFALELPSTDDPDINPIDWTYGVNEAGLRSYNIVVPYDTPPLNAPGDLLHGEQVIELIDVVPVSSPSPGTVQLLPTEIRTPAITVPDATIITIDARVNRVFKTVLQGNHTLDDPTNAYDGQTLIWIVEQGAGGGFTPTLGSKYRLPVGKFLSWSSATGRKDRLMLQYDGDDDKFDVLGFQPGYGA